MAQEKHNNDQQDIEKEKTALLAELLKDDCIDLDDLTESMRPMVERFRKRIVTDAKKRAELNSIIETFKKILSKNKNT